MKYIQRNFFISAFTGLLKAQGGDVKKVPLPQDGVFEKFVCLFF